MCYYAGLRDPVYNVATDNNPNIVYKATISSVRNITESGSDSHQTTYCNQIWKVSPKRLNNTYPQYLLVQLSFTYFV
jgi:hypothetical protein